MAGCGSLSQFRAEKQSIEHLVRLRWPGEFAGARYGGCQAHGCRAVAVSCRWQAAHSYTRGRWNGVSLDANRADQVISRRLSDGPR